MEDNMELVTQDNRHQFVIEVFKVLLMNEGTEDRSLIAAAYDEVDKMLSYYYNMQEKRAVTSVKEDSK